MKAIFDALNIIYDEEEKRGFIWLNVVSLFFTICAIAGAGLAVALVVVFPLITAELNSEIEHQTARDSTVGPDKPLGTRGAVMADTVGSAVTIWPSGADASAPSEPAWVYRKDPFACG